MSWTTPKDITDRWVGSGMPDDEDLVQAIINDAESIILSEYPRIQERINDGSLPLGTVVMVVSRMATRVLRNPENLTYWQQQTGPFGQARNWGDSPSDIWLTKDELQLLAPKRRGKAYMVDQGNVSAAFPPAYHDPLWPDKSVYPIWREVDEV